MTRVDPDTGEVLVPRLDEFGREIPDPRPLRIPAGMKRPETLAEQVQRMVRREWSQLAADQGFETFEESEDFDVGDDSDPTTQYETHFDPVLGKDISAAEFKQHEKRYRAAYLKAQGEYFARLDAEEAIRQPRAASKGKRGASRAGAAEAHTEAKPAPIPPEE